MMLKSRWRKLLVSVAALALVVGAAGFAMSKGYLMRFYINEAEISRDAYFDRAYASMDNPDSVTPMGCTAEWTVGLLYFYEIHCFESDDALREYMGST